MPQQKNTPSGPQNPTLSHTPPPAGAAPQAEIGGPKEADPTRYGDWVARGRCIDF